MNNTLALIALIVLIAVIAIGFVLKKNVGLIAMLAAAVLGVAIGQDDSTTIAGFSASTFVMLLGVSLLCTVATGNGTLELMAKKFLRLSGGHVAVAPIIMYLIGFIIAAVGPGCVPALGIVAALEQKPADFLAFLRHMEESGFQVKHGRGGAISFLAPGQDKYTRLRASTLGPGFDPDDIRAVIAGERPIPELPKDGPAPPRRVNLIIDIRERMAQGKGPGYERWAKVYNLKQMAAALQYLREHDLMDYDALAASTEAAVDRAHKLAGELRDTEAALSKTSELMGAVVQYAKTRPVFDGYKAARYSKKYLAQHEAELADYRAAKATMSDLLGGAKLPKMDALKKERRELSEKRKALYAEYRKAQAEMRQAVAVKANIDHLLGHTDGRENKAQER